MTKYRSIDNDALDELSRRGAIQQRGSPEWTWSLFYIDGFRTHKKSIIMHTSKYEI